MVWILWEPVLPLTCCKHPGFPLFFSSLDWCGVLIQFKVVKSLFSLKPKAKPMTVYREHLRNQEPEKLLFNFNAVAQRKRMVLSLLFISINWRIIAECPLSGTGAVTELQQQTTPFILSSNFVTRQVNYNVCYMWLQQRIAIWSGSQYKDIIVSLYTIISILKSLWMIHVVTVYNRLLSYTDLYNIT